MVLLSAGVAGPLPAGGLLPVVGSGTLCLADAVAVCATVRAVWRASPSLDRRRRATGLPTAPFPQPAAETFHASDIGMLYAAVSAGGVLAGLFSGVFTRVRRHGVAMAVSAGLWGLTVAGFGTARSLPAAVTWLLLAGGALLALGVFRKTVLQTAVPDGMRGRLQGIDTVVAAGGPPLGVLLHGTVAAALGVPTDPGPDKRRPTGPPDRDSRHKRERGATSGERDLPAS